MTQSRFQLEPNAPKQRIAYVYKQYPKQPWIALDLVRAVGTRLDYDEWRHRVVAAAAEADPQLLADMEALGLLVGNRSAIRPVVSYWQHFAGFRSEFWNARLQATSDTAALDELSRDKGLYDRMFSQVVGAIVETVGELDAFERNSPFDALLPWGARELSRFVKADSWWGYESTLDMLSDPANKLVDWFVKKKPDLMKMSLGEVGEAVKEYEASIEPETVFEWDDGWRVVQLTTSHHLDRVGTALRNCLRGDSSHHEGFCENIANEKADYFALVDSEGSYRVAVEWFKKDKSPEQVYAYNNSEPEGENDDRINEWIESRGGEPSNPIKRLRGSAREIADFIADHDSHIEDEDVAMYAVDWDNEFTASDAIEWIKLTGTFGLDEARLLSSLDLSPSEAEDLPDWIWEYLRNETPTESKAQPVIAAARLFVHMSPREGDRDNYSVHPKAQLAFPWEDRAKPQPVAQIPKGIPVEGDERALFREAWEWVQAGWEDPLYFDEAVEWWVRRFKAHEAAIYGFDLANYAKSNQTEVPYHVAEELRSRGISAQELMDAVPYINGTLDLENAESLIEQVEAARKAMLPNRRRPRGR